MIVFFLAGLYGPDEPPIIYIGEGTASCALVAFAGKIWSLLSTLSMDL